MFKGDCSINAFLELDAFAGYYISVDNNVHKQGFAVDIVRFLIIVSLLVINVQVSVFY